MTAGRLPYETAKPGTVIPVTGTDICGFARKASVSPISHAMLSLRNSGSHGAIFGCCSKVVNQSQADRPSVSTTTIARAIERGGRPAKSALTAHLHGPFLTKQLFRVAGLVRWTLDPDAVVPAAEPLVVPHRHRQAGNARVDEQAEHRGEPAEEHHDLEPEHRVGNP